VVYINALVLGGYALFGIVLLVGYLLNRGSLEALAAFCGWFLVVYSMGAYVFVAILHFYRRGHNFWATLYPVNLSLALVAILLFGIHDVKIILPLLAFSVLGFGVGLLFMHSSLANMRAVPLIVLIPLFLCLLPSISPYWTLAFSLVAACQLTSFADACLIRRTP
jgi:hypothetical protein